MKKHPRPMVQCHRVGIHKLVADVDHDGSITEDDAELILQHSVATATINQNVAITQAVDSSCYFQSSVTF